ncbi:putative peptide upstream ORF protein [Senna tora]|uniref:Putative peptide upstream ORF protein n=1 Tax=Senna tora TaxID=362788 RepID=A0A834SVU2_9FABA|nr:putative peptide upstream ORF protein [Senna tora]
MDAKTFTFQILTGSIARRALVRAFLLASALSIVSLVRVLPNLDLGAFAPITYHDCLADSDSDSTNSRILNTVWGSFDSKNCKQDVNLTVNMVTELMGKHFLDFNAKSLCVGEGALMAVSAMQQLGFSSVTGVHKHRFFSLAKKKFVYELNYQDSSFDFVFSRDLDKVSVPALLVLEVERILKPGGIGALLVGASRSNPNDLIRSATPVSSLLRSSSVVHVGYINELNLVVFKKRSENGSSFDHYNLPADCPSLTLTKPLIDLMEPLVEERPPPEFEKRISYLPKFVDVSTRKRLVYIDIGVGKLLNANVSDWFPPSYPIDQKAFNVYLVHYNTSIMLSYVKRPGVTFVYHPGLAGDVAAKLNTDGEVDPSLGEEEFDFLAWFKETVEYADYVVLKMNAGKVERKFLSDIFESEAICYVDELFLGCPDSGDDKGMVAKKNCMDMYNGLRSSGVYVHQWWGD